MPVSIAAWVIVGAVFCRMLALVAAQLRAALPSVQAGPSDVTVTILFMMLAPSPQGASLVVASVANPGSRPVLAGLSVRRRRYPGWPGAGLRTRVARRTGGRRYRAGRQATIGIIPAHGASVLPVHFRATRGRYRVVAVIGQSDHRLRVISLPLARRADDDTRSSSVSITDLFPWLT
jgi:hypothetical protein